VQRSIIVENIISHSCWIHVGRIFFHITLEMNIFPSIGLFDDCFWLHVK